MNILRLLAILPSLALLLAHDPARAGGDHDHGHGHDHGAAAAPGAGMAQPRFAATSELFELVGVLQGQQLTLYLDRAADNSPVTTADIELEIGNQKFKAAKQGNDTFQVLLPAAPKPGVLSITATVLAGGETDLLAGELDIHEAALATAPHATHGWAGAAAWAGGAAGLLLVGGGLAWAARSAAHRAKATRTLRSGGTA